MGLKRGQKYDKNVYQQHADRSKNRGAEGVEKSRKTAWPFYSTAKFANFLYIIQNFICNNFFL